MDEYRRNPLNPLSDAGWYKKIDVLAGVSLGDVVSIKSGLFRISSTGILSDMRESVSGVVERTDNKKMRVLFWKTGI
jgi:shikimate kinase